MVVSYQSLKSRTQKGVYAKYVEGGPPRAEGEGQKLVINLVILNGWLLMVK